MSRKKSEEAPGPSGFLVVDKPPGWTSHAVVDAARRWLGTRRVGHLGTLDPLATGVLPLAVRDATKLLPFLPPARKRYRAVVRFGVETDTYDAEGRETRRHDGPLPDVAALRAALARFVGDLAQVPPMFSAVKQGGVPLYRLARRGEEVERAPRAVRIERLDLLRFDPARSPDLEIDLTCSAGTYVRVLAHDLGRALGCGAHVLALRRTSSGPFTEDAARSVEALDAAAARGAAAELLLPPLAALAMPVVALGDDAVQRVLHGGEIAAPREAEAAAGAHVAAVDEHGELLAILEGMPRRRLRPVRVLRGAVAARYPV
jgi:tRNA pseudouridine55 synthase